MITLLYKFILGIRKLPRFLIKNVPKLIIFLVNSVPKLIIFLVKTIHLGGITIFNILDRFSPISILLYSITFIIVGIIIEVKIIGATNYNFCLELAIMMIIFIISIIIINLLAITTVGIIMQLRGWYNDKNYL